MALKRLCFLRRPFKILRQYSNSAAPRPVVFSGIQPTGTLHLGNYFGAIQRWIELQQTDKQLIFCIVDLHALTTPQGRTDLGGSITSLTAGLLACGVDPARATLFLQSAVPQHTQLGWLLACLTSMPRLSQLPQCREKAAALGHTQLGLFSYPVLQAADILIHRATEVPVGQDQLQHIQLAQHLAKAFNRQFGELFPRPRATGAGDNGARVLSLRNPAHKMSKSDPDQRACVYLTDSPDTIRAKLRKALTDHTSEVYADSERRPAVTALMQLHALAADTDLDGVRRAAAGLSTAQWKLQLAEVLVERLAPVRQRWQQLAADPGYLHEVLRTGRRQAAERAEETWAQVQRRLQLPPD